MKIKIIMSFIGLSFLISACGAKADTSTQTNTLTEENDVYSENEIKISWEADEESEKEELDKAEQDKLEKEKDNESEEKIDKEETKEVKEDEPDEPDLTAMELEEILLQQPCYVENIDYIRNDAGYGADVSVVVKNNSGTDIKNVFYAMAGWDTNNLPLILYTYKAVNGTGYIVENDFGDPNIVNGGTYGEDLLFGIKEETASRLETFKAVVIKYEDFDGNTWENPYYEDWIKLYKEKKLEP